MIEPLHVRMIELRNRSLHSLNVSFIRNEAFTCDLISSQGSCQSHRVSQKLVASTELPPYFDSCGSSGATEVPVNAIVGRKPSALYLLQFDRLKMSDMDRYRPNIIGRADAPCPCTFTNSRVICQSERSKKRIYGSGIRSI